MKKVTKQNKSEMGMNRNEFFEYKKNRIVELAKKGADIETMAKIKELSGTGNNVYKIADKKLYPYTSLPHASALINLFKEIHPQICLMGASSIGRDLGPRVSSCLHSGLTADCTALEIGDHTDPKTGIEYKDLLYQIRPAFGGNIVATIVNPECRPQMATVREGVMKKEIFDANYKGNVVELDASKYIPASDFVVSIIDRHIAKSKINIKHSHIALQ